MRVDKQSRKIANSLRKLFVAIDIECGADQEALSTQIMLSKQEITEKRKIITCHQDMIKKATVVTYWLRTKFRQNALSSTCIRKSAHS
ncbi:MULTISPECIES: hypothetical protein [Xenorhabdus]|uniref:hypothetical protein n=1 Tax=Xenorhabdus TaxID=626 RepID=UPI001F1BF24D|nr:MULTISPECIES: hypothetical protein [Xenorhabdus]